MANETLTDVFSDIADAIRAKGVTGQMTPLQMPTKIADIPSGGSGDPFYEADGQGVVRPTTGINVNWFNNATSISQNGLKQAYANKP